jgi:hypothetical protein
MGMAITLVIGIWISGEFAVDKSYPDRRRIVEIMQDQRPKGTSPGSPITYREMTVSSALTPLDLTTRSAKPSDIITRIGRSSE